MYPMCHPACPDKNFSDTDKGDEPTWDDSWPLPQLSSGDFTSYPQLRDNVENWIESGKK